VTAVRRIVTFRAYRKGFAPGTTHLVDDVTLASACGLHRGHAAAQPHAPYDRSQGSPGRCNAGARSLCRYLEVADAVQVGTIVIEFGSPRGPVWGLSPSGLCGDCIAKVSAMAEHVSA